MTKSATPSARGSQPTMPTENQLATLRGMLEQQRRFRLDQLDQLQRSQQPGAYADVDLEISASLIAGARAALRDVVDALQRMEDGRYGSCRRCGSQLPIERLEILPQVSLCMTCQRADQREEHVG